MSPASRISPLLLSLVPVVYGWRPMIGGREPTVEYRPPTQYGWGNSLPQPFQASSPPPLRGPGGAFPTQVRHQSKPFLPLPQLSTPQPLQLTHHHQLMFPHEQVTFPQQQLISSQPQLISPQQQLISPQQEVAFPQQQQLLHFPQTAGFLFPLQLSTPPHQLPPRSTTSPPPTPSVVQGHSKVKKYGPVEGSVNSVFLQSGKFA